MCMYVLCLLFAPQFSPSYNVVGCLAIPAPYSAPTRMCDDVRRSIKRAKGAGQGIILFKPKERTSERKSTENIECVFVFSEIRMHVYYM